MTAQSPTLRSLGKRLGHGSFGTVYECFDTDGKATAVKTMEFTETGIPSMLEFSILSTYLHPHLNEAFKIDTVKVGEAGHYTCAFMAKADHDLEVEYKNQLPSLTTHRLWCQQLAQAVDCLHQQGIVHCDIKPSNCLVFDGVVRLTDYTLSVRKVSPDDVFGHSICTIHYRAPEVLMGAPWNEAVDIWSLGCLYYTVATGELLIPHQGSKLDTRLDEDQQRLQLKRKNLAAIIDWRRSLGDPAAAGIAVKEDNYLPVRMNSGWDRIPDDFKALILKMTSFEAKDRPTIEDILKHPYFRDLPIHPLRIRGTGIQRKIDEVQERQIERIAGPIIREMTGDKIVFWAGAILQLTKDLYGRCINMTPSGGDGLTRIEGCLWIASKLLTGDTPDKRKLQSPYHLVLEMEKRICKYLEYRLHVTVDDKLFMVGFA